MVLKGKNHETWIIEEWLDLCQGNKVCNFCFTSVYCTPVSNARTGLKDYHTAHVGEIHYTKFTHNISRRNNTLATNGAVNRRKCPATQSFVP